jgi:hypothetical protein
MITISLSRMTGPMSMVLTREIYLLQGKKVKEGQEQEEQEEGEEVEWKETEEN